jgi:hypothetical protein
MLGAAGHMRPHRALGPKLPNRVGALQKTVENGGFSVKALELPKRVLWVGLGGGRCMGKGKSGMWARWSYCREGKAEG